MVLIAAVAVRVVIVGGVFVLVAITVIGVAVSGDNGRDTWMKVAAENTRAVTALIAAIKKRPESVRRNLRMSRTLLSIAW